jgi:hypothetical protein
MLHQVTCQGGIAVKSVAYLTALTPSGESDRNSDPQLSSVSMCRRM